MANEIRIRAKINYSPASGDTVSLPWKDLFISQTGESYTSGKQLIGTTEEVIAVSGDIGTQGMWYIENLHASQSVKIGFADVSTADDARPITIDAGEFAIFRATGALYAKASGADTPIAFLCIES